MPFQIAVVPLIWHLNFLEILVLIWLELNCYFHNLTMNNLCISQTHRGRESKEREREGDKDRHKQINRVFKMYTIVDMGFV